MYLLIKLEYFSFYILLHLLQIEYSTLMFPIYLIAPAVKPLTSWRSMSKNRTTTGRVVRKDTAIKYCHST